MFPTLTGMNESMTSDPAGQDQTRSGWFDLSMRQLTVVAFGGIALVTVVAAAAYMAGRLAEIEGRSAKAPVATAAAATATEQIIVVDPPSRSAKAAVAPTMQAPKPQPVSPPPVAAQPAPLPQVAAPPSAATVPSVAAGAFFQVAALDRAMADVSADYLTRKGFPAKVADGPTPNVFRVLVGPLGDEQKSNEMKIALEGLGFRPFLKRM